MFTHVISAVKAVHIFMARSRVSKCRLKAELCFHRYVHFACVPIYININIYIYIYMYIYIYYILAKLSTWYFEHFGDISCSLFVNPGHTDES